MVTDPRNAPAITETCGERRSRWARVTSGRSTPVRPTALVEPSPTALAPHEGQRCWDLYAGVGLFTAMLAERVGTTGGVVAVESHRRAATHARANLADLPQARVVTERVNQFVRAGLPRVDWTWSCSTRRGPAPAAPWCAPLRGAARRPLPTCLRPGQPGPRRPHV